MYWCRGGINDSDSTFPITESTEITISVANVDQGVNILPEVVAACNALQAGKVTQSKADSNGFKEQRSCPIAQVLATAAQNLDALEV